MQSIATITTAASVTRLTTVARVKQELDITSNDNDALLGSKIDEATSEIEAHLGRFFRRETLTETFWGDSECAQYLILARAPVASITSVTIDDVAVDSTEWRLDAATGILHRLDSTGYPSFWSWCKSVVVVYVAGYLLPGEVGRTLPEAIEAGALSLMSAFWQSRGRDPLVKSEEIPGVERVDYWVGYIGEAGQLPPDVITKIAPFRRVLV